MKKETRSKYFLGIALFAVWGLLGFRVYQKMNPDYTLPALTEQQQISTPSTFETFALSEKYRDPFLGKHAAFVNHDALPAREPNRQPARKRPPQSAIVFPEIEYKGRIKTKDGRTAAVVSVNQSVMNLGAGESYQNVELLRIYQDSIRVEVKGYEKSIPRAR